MTTNDGQIDLLIRRFATQIPASGAGGEHLDADELNAFAEGALPAAARAYYVSHLAECDQCRRQASDLAIASGAVVRVAPEVPEKYEAKGLWAMLAGSLSLPALRYAAFAAVLLIVAGVAFVALRRRSEPNLVALNEQRQEQPASAVKPQSDAGDVTNTAGNVNNTNENKAGANAPTVSQTPAPASAGVISTTDAPKVDTTKAPATAAPPEPAKEIAAAEIEPMKKGEVTTKIQTQPAYAPAPPGESPSNSRFTQNQAPSGAAQAQGGGFRAQQGDKLQAEDRERDAAKDARLDDAARQRSNDSVLAQKRGADEKQKGGPSRNMDNVAMNNRNSNEVLRTETVRKSDGAPADEEAPQTRSVGGRKFARQGSRWVDQKFKSSMSLNNIARGSDEFAALDSGLRSIAQQLGGEVIVVWKGKAYLIK